MTVVATGADTAACTTQSSRALQIEEVKVRIRFVTVTGSIYRDSASAYKEGAETTVVVPADCVCILPYHCKVAVCWLQGFVPTPR